MGLLFVGPEVQDPISCLVMDGDAVWAASGAHVIKYLRGKEVSRLSNPLRTPPGILHYIWLSIACIDGRWRADANMGDIDQ